MKDKRTHIDFTKHEVHVTKTDDLLIHHIKLPNTIMNSVKFINTNGIMAVTGDFGNWIFCREFHPSDKGGVSDGYWLEKLKIYSDQTGVEFSEDLTRARLKETLIDLEDYGYKGDELKEAKEYYKKCLRELSDTCGEGYKRYMYDEMPSFLDYDGMVYEEDTQFWLKCVFDAFDEICSRYKKGLLA